MILAMLLLLALLAQAVDVPDLRTRKTGADWPNFLGPSQDSTSAETGLLQAWPAEGPRVVWQRALGEGYGPPAVQKGRLFHMERVGPKLRVLGLKSETGEELWRFEYPCDYQDLYGYDGGPRTAPVADDDRLYAYGPEGTLHCLRATDGAVLWKKDLSAEYGVVQNFFGVGSAPVVEGDLLLVQVGGSPPGSPGIQSGEVKGAGSALVAFDKRTGAVKYRMSDELASYASPRTATIDGRRWGFLFARGGLLGFEPATGKVDFHFPWRAPILESVNASQPVVVGDLVLISECYGVGGALLKVRPGAAETVWADGRKRDRSLMTHWMTSIHLDGHVYASSGRHPRDAELRCVELRTGKVKWSEPGLLRASLLLADGRFVCLSEDGTLRLLKPNPERYEEVAKLALRTAEGAPLLRYPAWAAPVLAHGYLYVRGKDRLACLDLLTK
jgi:outer membrane protein assembly factor BamB